MVRTEGEKLQALLSGLEGPRCRGRYANGVQRTDVQELIVELDPAAPAENDVDLLGIGMSMCEGAALPGEQAKERDTGALGPQRVARHTRLPAIAKAVPRDRVVDRGQADIREGFRHETPSFGGRPHHCSGDRG